MILIALLIVLTLIGAVILYMISPAKRREIFLSNGPKYYAHRGLYTADQTVPENSLPAFSLAVHRNYGIELDVQLTKDGKIVVFHDDDLLRCTGIRGRTGDYTFDELERGMRLFDTDCRIPLFHDVLGLICGKVPLIIELKACPEWRELCRSVLHELNTYEGLYCVESFDPKIVNWYRIHAPEIIRGQLSEQYRHSFRQFGPVLSFCSSRLLGNFLSRPDFIAYRLGRRPLLAEIAWRMSSCRVGWTMGPSEASKHLSGDSDILIFEHLDPDKTVSA